MAMIGNFSNRNFGSGHNIGSNLAMSVGARTNGCRWYGFTRQDGASTALDRAAYPTGDYARTAYYMPYQIGEMSMDGKGSGSLSGDLLPTLTMGLDLTGEGDMTAFATLAAAMAAAFTGNGSFTAAIVGNLNASIDFTGTGNLSADIGALGNMLIELLGSGDLDATVAAFGDMEIEITVTGTGLTTANVGQAVWSAVAATNNVAGTMGEKLNDAGSASNPWTEALEGTVTAGDMMRIITAVLAGSASGMDSNAIFKSLDGTKNRVTATISGDDRDVTSIDPS